MFYRPLEPVTPSGVSMGALQDTYIIPVSLNFGALAYPLRIWRGVADDLIDGATVLER